MLLAPLSLSPLGATALVRGEAAQTHSDHAIDPAQHCDGNVPDEWGSTGAHNVKVRPSTTRLYRELRGVDLAAAARLDNHAVWQRRILDAIPDDSNRFLVFKPRRTGVGNVIEALVSSLLFAVVTHRVFLVDWAPSGPPSALPFITAELCDALDFPLAPQHLALSHPNVRLHYEAAVAAGSLVEVGPMMPVAVAVARLPDYNTSPTWTPLHSTAFHPAHRGVSTQPVVEFLSSRVHDLYSLFAWVRATLGYGARPWLGV
jgi:hypothetical protein